MYCMNCGQAIPEDGQFCPACGNDVPRKVPPRSVMPAYPPGYPPQMPQYYSPYPGFRQPVIVVPMANPLPPRPPMRQRVRERWEVYMQQARENILETGLSIVAAGMVIIGVLAMMAASL